MSKKAPTPIVDKNGKQTTVHKNVGTPDVPLRLQAAKPFAAVATPEQKHAKQIGFIADLSHDFRQVFPGTERIEIGTDAVGDSKVNKTLDADGNKTEFNTDLDRNVAMGMNRVLRNLDYSKGIELGYITALEPNTDNSLYAIDLNKVDAVVQDS